MRRIAGKSTPSDSSSALRTLSLPQVFFGGIPGARRLQAPPGSAQRPQLVRQAPTVMPLGPVSRRSRPKFYESAKGPVKPASAEGV